MRGLLELLMLLIAAAVGYSVYSIMVRSAVHAGDHGPSSSRAVAGAIGGIASAGLLAIVGWLGINSFGIIPAGDVGIVTSWGRPTGEIKDNGWYFAPSPLGYSVYVMHGTAIRSWPINNASAATFDLQQVTTDITMNFHLASDRQSLLMVYADLRDNFDNVIGPITLEALKAVTAHYTAQNLIDQRAKAKDELDALLRERLAKFGVVIDNVSLTQFRFSDQFNAAIEAKVTQEQAALQAKAKLDQVKYEAEQTITKAKADAEALAMKRQNLTPELVQQQFIEKWDGHMPSVLGSGSIVNMPSAALGQQQQH